MKKLILGSILLCVILGLCCGCGSRPGPVPAFPLDAAAVERALDASGLSWTVAGEESWGKGRVFFELCNEDKKTIAYLSSVGEDGQRVLQLTFFSATETAAPLPPEDWEKAVSLATVLYGGFKDESQVYQAFHTADEETIIIDAIPGAVPGNQERIRWTSVVQGVDCFIGLRRRNVDTDAPTTEFVSIVLSGSDEAALSSRTN